MRRAWTEQDLDTLRLRWPSADINELAAEMGRTVKSLRQKARLLRLFRRPEVINAARRIAWMESQKTKPAVWSAAEVAKLRAAFKEGANLAELSIKLDRSQSSVMHKAIRLGLRRVAPRPRSAAVTLPSAAMVVFARAVPGDAAKVLQDRHPLDLAWSRHGLGSPHGQPAEPAASVGQHTDRRAA